MLAINAPECATEERTPEGIPDYLVDQEGASFEEHLDPKVEPPIPQTPAASDSPDSTQRGPDWDPLFGVLERGIERERLKAALAGVKFRGPRTRRPASLEAFRQFMLEHGVESPLELPDYATVREWAREDGLRQNQWDSLIHAYRQAVRLNGDPRYPEIMQEVRTQDRGLRSLPDLGERLFLGGCKRDPRDMHITEIIDVLAPHFGKALTAALLDGTQRSLSLDWHREQADGTSRLLASMIRLGVSPTERTFMSLWNEKFVLPAPPTEVDDLIAIELGENVPEFIEVSLIRRIVEECAALGTRRSPLRPVTHGDADEAESGVRYVETIGRDMSYGWGITRITYEKALAQYQSEKWKDAKGEFGLVLTHIADTNQRIDTIGHVCKDYVIGYGELVCVALPRLRRKAIDALEALDTLVANPPKGRMTRAYRTQVNSVKIQADKWLTRYVQFAIVLDDGLREKNYSCALAGIHIIPEVIRCCDEPVAFESVETVFEGFDHPDVRLKIKTRKRRGKEKERVRKRHLSRGIVDHHLLFRYWYETRARNAVRRELVLAIEDFDAEDGRYAVFIGSRKAEERRHRAGEPNPRAVNSGRLTTDGFRLAFKRTLIWLLNEVGVKVPGKGDELDAKWRGILGPHILRTAIATYFGGIRGDWTTAILLTDDTQASLEEHYVAVKAEVSRLLKTKGVKNPRWFDQVLDRIIANDPGEDWSAFWDEFDPTADPNSTAMGDRELDT